jgi:hypothetical protein
MSRFDGASASRNFVIVVFAAAPPQSLVRTNGGSKGGLDALRRQLTTQIMFALSSIQANVSISPDKVSRKNRPRIRF